MRCAVLNCNENNNKVKPTVRFYCFPKNNTLKRQWLDFCRRKDPINTKNARICSAHFNASDFERNMQFEMGFCRNNGFPLKPHTVPSVQPIPKSFSSRSKRKQPAVKQEILESLEVEVLDTYEGTDCGEETETQKAQENNSSECDSVYTESLENRIFYLSHEVETLKQENSRLQANEKSSNLKIRALQRLLKKSELDRIEVEDKLRQIFAKGIIIFE